MNLKVLAMCLTISATAATLSGAPANGSIVELWPEGVPNAKGTAEEEVLDDGRYSAVHEPTLTYFAPAVDRPARTAVIVCPGGGYSHLSFAREGEQYANWLSQLGISAFVLKYRMGEYGHPAPLQDVLRAIRLIRSEAETYGIDVDRIGVMGSSAGGHLAASASTLFDHPDGKTGAKIDAISARPDFAILMYPVITMTGEASHEGSRLRLLGPHPATSLLELASVQLQVTAATPPTLLFHTQEDATVPVENSLLYFQALTKAGVPAEIYVFERGAHGVAMNPGLGTTSHWPLRAAEWLRAKGYALE